MVALQFDFDFKSKLEISTMSSSSDSSSPKPAQKKHWCYCGPHPLLYRIHLHSARLEGTRDRKRISMVVELNELILMGEAVKLHICPSVLGRVATTRKCCWASTVTRLSEVFRRTSMIWMQIIHPSVANSLGLNQLEQKEGHRSVAWPLHPQPAMRIIDCCYPRSCRSQKVRGELCKDNI